MIHGTFKKFAGGAAVKQHVAGQAKTDYNHSQYAIKFVCQCSIIFSLKIVKFKRNTQAVHHGERFPTPIFTGYFNHFLSVQSKSYFRRLAGGI